MSDRFPHLLEREATFDSEKAAMGNDHVLNDLCVLKTKILEVFEDLMVCDGFSNNHQEKLCEAFNLLEESLSLMSDVSVEIKSETFIGPTDREICTSDTDTKITETREEGQIQIFETSTEVQVPEGSTEEMTSRKRNSSEREEEQVHRNGIHNGPPVKRGRGRPRKVSNIDTTDLPEQTQRTSNRERPKPELTKTVAEYTIGKDSRPKGAGVTNDALNLAIESVKEEKLEGNVVLNVKVPETPKRGRGRPKKEKMESSQSEGKFKESHRVECADCKKVLCNKAEIEDHVCHTKDDIHAVYKCDNCDINFKTKDVMLNHMSNHKDKVTASCRLCSKTFQYACLLRIHSHGSEGNFMCNQCDQVFTYKRQFTLHASTHEIEKDVHKERKFSCNVCGKRFTRTDHLSDHMKIHTGARPRICEFCAKGFLNNSDLRRHLRIHTGAKPYVCPQCKRGFSQKCTLDKHLHQHEKKANPQKMNKPSAANKQTPRTAPYTYKQMMKDLGKTPEPSTTDNVEEQADGRKDMESIRNKTDKSTAQNRTPIKSSPSKSPKQSSRPQLFTLLTKQPLNMNVSETDRLQITKSSMFPQSTGQPVMAVTNSTHEPLVPVTSTDKRHMVPCVQNLQMPITVPSGGQTAEMVQMEDGSTRIILPDSLDVGEEILVYVEKVPESVSDESIKQIESEKQKKCSQTAETHDAYSK